MNVAIGRREKSDNGWSMTGEGVRGEARPHRPPCGGGELRSDLRSTASSDRPVKNGLEEKGQEQDWTVGRRQVQTPGEENTRG